MDFTVRRIAEFKELTVSETRTTIESGLLDRSESVSLGAEMFEAAQELIGEDDFKTLIKEHFTKEDLFGEDDD